MTSVSHRIFVSHSHLDNDFGTRLAQDLRRVLKDESAIFYDVLGGLHGGETWWEKIVEELTARDVFLLALSPDAMNSRWVRLEINIALNKSKLIVPVLYRPCAIRADLETIQIISFLAPKPYEAAFQEVLMALNLPLETPIEPKERKSQPSDPATRLIHQMEAAFAEHDWPDVIRKANYLIKHMPERISSTVYRWQGLALLEEGEVQQAQEALETALALVSDRELRLTLLGDYTGLLVRQEQWSKVLQQAKEALRLTPRNPAWLATQQQAQDQLSQQVPKTSPSQKQEQTKDKELSSTPPKTREQWEEEGNTLYDLKRYEEALSAHDQAIRLDPNYARAYYDKGFDLRDLKRYEEALSAFDQAIRLDPNDADAYYGKGITLERLGKKQEAQQAHSKARQLGYSDQ
ncbi:MAG: toll/interleukin-1 receptor domain-containing protein [Ktedonobacteraceae bacterium]